MTSQQQQALDIASRLGVDPGEIDRAIRLAQTGRIDLIILASAKRLSIRAALESQPRPRTAAPCISKLGQGGKHD